MNTQTSNKTAQKYFDILNSGSITEQQIISLRSYLNNKGNADFKREFFNKWEDELTLSLEQNQKGYDFLISQWKTPTGRERVNNPFGYREQSILENFKDFTLKGLYDAGNMYVQNYLPLYSCNSNDGGSFEYYYYNGKINIVG